ASRRSSSGECGRGRSRTTPSLPGDGRRRGTSCPRLLQCRTRSSWLAHLPAGDVAALAAQQLVGLLVQDAAQGFVERHGEVGHLRGAVVVIEAPAPDGGLTLLGKLYLVENLGHDQAHNRPGLVRFENDLHTTISPSLLAIIATRLAPEEQGTSNA